jgi:hypothetical protein
MTASNTANLNAASDSVHPNPNKESRLISPDMDVLLIGGASVAIWALMKICLKPEVPDVSIAWFVYTLSFIVNFPHFLASYQLLYLDNRKRLYKEFRFFWASVIVPGILIGALTVGFSQASSVFLGYMLNAMFFFVGWHYVKQVFGAMTVANATKGYFFGRFERPLLKCNLYSLWAISYLGSNIGSYQYSQDGIPYQSLNLPDWTLAVAYVVLNSSAALLAQFTIRKFLMEGRWPTKAAVVCLLSLYVWYLPVLSHPMFGHLVPFFHSAQYLMFVYVLRRNKTASSIAEGVRTGDWGADSPLARWKTLLGLWGYYGLAVLTGGVFMYFLPKHLDGLGLVTNAAFGVTPFFFAFQVFINIHHYFIDNVIWRGDSPDLRRHLFQTAAS